MVGKLVLGLGCQLFLCSPANALGESNSVEEDGNISVDKFDEGSALTEIGCSLSELLHKDNVSKVESKGVKIVVSVSVSNAASGLQMPDVGKRAIRVAKAVPPQCTFNEDKARCIVKGDIAQILAGAAQPRWEIQLRPEPQAPIKSHPADPTFFTPAMVQVVEFARRFLYSCIKLRSGTEEARTLENCDTFIHEGGIQSPNGSQVQHINLETFHAILEKWFTHIVGCEFADPARIPGPMIVTLMSDQELRFFGRYQCTEWYLKEQWYRYSRPVLLQVAFVLHEVQGTGIFLKKFEISQKQ